MSPGSWNWQGGLTPSLYLSVEAHSHTVDDVGDDEDGGLIPGDHSIGNSKYENDDTHEVTKAIPTTRFSC